MGKGARTALSAIFWALPALRYAKILASHDETSWPSFLHFQPFGIRISFGFRILGFGFPVTPGCLVTILRRPVSNGYERSLRATLPALRRASAGHRPRGVVSELFEGSYPEDRARLPRRRRLAR